MSRRKRPDYSKFQEKDSNSSNNKGRKDERFWVLSKDENFNGNAVIRFLPNKNQEEIPYKLMYKHNVYLGKNSFLDRCPTTIEKDCPVCQWNKDLNDRDFVYKKGLYRKKSWICNILVINDPANEENNGKVFLFEFGKQIYDILMDAINPEIDEDDDEDDRPEPIWYFDLDEGVNFKLKLKKEGTFPTWVKSKFANSPSTLESEIERFGLEEDDIINQLYDLDTVIPESSYKEYNELQLKFKNFLDRAELDSTSIQVEKAEDEALETYKSSKASASKKAKQVASMDESDEGDDDGDEEYTPPAPKPKTNKKSKKDDAVDDKVKKLSSVKDYFKNFDDDDE